MKRKELEVDRKIIAKKIVILSSSLLNSKICVFALQSFYSVQKAIDILIGHTLEQRCLSHAIYNGNNNKTK